MILDALHRVAHSQVTLTLLHRQDTVTAVALILVPPAKRVILASAVVHLGRAQNFIHLVLQIVVTLHDLAHKNLHHVAVLGFAATRRLLISMLGHVLEVG